MTDKQIDFKYDGVRWTVRLEPVDALERLTARLPAAGEATLVVKPPAAGSGSVTVELTASNTADINAGTAMWAPAEGLGAAGVVSALILETIPSTITAVRITATGAGARVEIAQ